MGAARVLDSPAWGNLTIALFAFAVGVLSLHQSANLPGVGALGLLAIVGVCLLRWRLYVPVGFIGGLVWAAFCAQGALAHRLPIELQGVDLTIVGEVQSVQRDDAGFTRLVLNAPRTVAANDWRPRRIRLGWYGPQQPLLPGERWQLQVRLRQPTGFANPVGFDYERWLFSQGIDAVGYVHRPETAHRLQAGWSLHQIRKHIADAIASRLSSWDARGVIVALAVGERRWIDEHQWDVLRLTGTAHLVAISGLHVGLIALLSGACVTRLWRLSASACEILPARLPGVLAGIMAAVVYSMLAGFTLPTQRALIMLLVPACAWLARRRVRGWHGFGIALAAVLLWDPFAPLAAGFWLSFGAVGLLIAVGSDRARLPWLYAALQTQLVASFGLLAVTVLWLQTAAWLAPLANLIAIPVVGLLVVPLTLLGALVMAIAPDAVLLLDVAAWLMGWVLQGLEWLALHSPPGDVPALPNWALILAVLAAFVLVLPRGSGVRWLALPMLVPVAVGAPLQSRFAESVRLTFFDVGQGSAIVMEAGGEVALFNTGPASKGLDTAEHVLLPYLRSRGYRQIDWLFISQARPGQSGGADTLVRALDIEHIRVGEPISALGDRQPCRAGEWIQWQGVDFEFLWPSQGNGPCVLRVHAAGVRILLAGELDKSAERALVSQHGDGLRSEILLVPRQGHRQSSSPALVQAISPDYALISTSYDNRYGYPHPETVARYQAIGAQVRTTAAEGALIVRVHGNGTFQLDGQRRRQARYYHRQAEP